MRHRLSPAAAGVFLVGILLCASASADQLADIKGRGTLVCGVVGVAEPFSFPSPTTREVQGYDIDFCKALAIAMGVKLELKQVAVAARIPELTQGRIDLLSAALGYTAERAEQVDFSHQYYATPTKVLVRKVDGFKSIKDLAGKQLSTVKGSSADAAVRKAIPQAGTATFQDPPTAFLALMQGKVSGLAASELALARFRDQVGSDQPLVILPEPLMLEPWGIGVKKNEPALLAQVNATLDRMERSGEASKIFDHWLGAGSPYKTVRDFRIGPIPR